MFYNITYLLYGLPLQGVFLFPNGFKRTKKFKKKLKSNLNECLSKDPWYETFKCNWELIESQLKVSISIV